MTIRSQTAKNQKACHCCRVVYGYATNSVVKNQYNQQHSSTLPHGHTTWRITSWTPAAAVEVILIYGIQKGGLIQRRSLASFRGTSIEWTSDGSRCWSNSSKSLSPITDEDIESISSSTKGNRLRTDKCQYKRQQTIIQNDTAGISQLALFVISESKVAYRRQLHDITMETEFIESNDLQCS